eukprot:gnl/MRDRNA2_/MRDRNA2_107224_c0_seq1.p1 gnl/MRDRNA2_/MRDRNA2_107224_c0~~gnl/MRDRNA2_/MRDRNA2_107224_c0_seq1.p1  ORF type:complete len:146 (-),score=23.21 gnl/MRDRNA2_/MRDRNA2_107224_c0_seq1:7-444(-)
MKLSGLRSVGLSSLFSSIACIFIGMFLGQLLHSHRDVGKAHATVTLMNEDFGLRQVTQNGHFPKGPYTFTLPESFRTVKVTVYPSYKNWGKLNKAIQFEKEDFKAAFIALAELAFDERADRNLTLTQGRNSMMADLSLIRWPVVC